MRDVYFSPAPAVIKLHFDCERFRELIELLYFIRLFIYFLVSSTFGLSGGGGAGIYCVEIRL